MMRASIKLLVVLIVQLGKKQLVSAGKETGPGITGNLLMKGKQGACVQATAF